MDGTLGKKGKDSNKICLFNPREQKTQTSSESQKRLKRLSKKGHKDLGEAG
jgi:hypothetical protein